MELAAFAIKKYQFDKVSIDLENHFNNEISLSFEPSGIYYRQNSKYDLIFVLSAFNETKESTPFVKIQCIGTFEFENIEAFEDIPEFFFRNCIAILFPYVRAYVSIVTTQANVPGIMLPTLNLSPLEGTLRQNTTQK